MKMSAQNAEQLDNQKLARANEAIEYYKEKETEALKSLAEIRKSLAVAREKHEALFRECESNAVARRKAGFFIGY